MGSINALLTLIAMDKPKFIIKNNQFIMGWVELHMDLVPETHGVKGGGWWHLSEDEKELTLYSSSMDFGPVTKDQIIEVFQKGEIPISVNQHLEKVYYSMMTIQPAALMKREHIMNVDGNHIDLITNTVPDERGKKEKEEE